MTDSLSDLTTRLKAAQDAFETAKVSAEHARHAETEALNRLLEAERERDEALKAVQERCR